MLMKKLVASAATAALALSFGAAAHAQSTGSQEVTQVVVTARRGPATVVGVVAESGSKARATINQDFIATQPVGQSVFQSLNLVPGVNFTNNDPYGSSGGNLRLRGFDGPRISFTWDGIPLNDTGNYSIFTNQVADPEIIQNTNVNQGTTDVDSPTASATGGTINIVTRNPSKNLDAMLSGALGRFNYGRIAGLIDSGQIGPFNTSAFIEGSYQDYDKFKGPGELEKKQFNAKIYQPVGNNGDFMAVAFHYNENRNNNYRTVTMNEFLLNGRGYDFDTTCNPASATGKVGNGVFQGPIPGNCTNYFGRQVNPSNTGNIRGTSSFHLLSNLKLTIDPWFQYVLADGGGQLGTIDEYDGRVVGTSGTTTTSTCATNAIGGTTVRTGKDLNGNGTVCDTVAFFTPSVTNTRRYGLNTSLIYDLNENNRLRIAYALDYGRHRQTGEYTYLTPTGDTLDVFGGKDGNGPKVATADGSFLRGRDRFSIAELNLVAFEYRGKFFDDTLTINAGVRLPFFKRDLNQFCYSQNGSSSVLCTTQTPNAALANGNVTFGAGATQYIKPYSTTKKYDATLPTLGLTYEFLPRNSIFANFSEGLSAPRTDNLYTVTRVGTGTVADPYRVTNPSVQPERTKAYDIGYRYTSRKLLITVDGWYINYTNRIVSSFDDTLGVFIDRNVGGVDAYGFDGQMAVELEPWLRVSATASYNNSQLTSNIPVGIAAAGNPGGFAVGTILTLPTKGKQLAETPDWTFGGRAEWDVLSDLHLGAQMKFVGKRYSTDVNDEVAPRYTTFDADARYDLKVLGLTKSWVQLNITNLFDDTHFGSISSRNNATSILGVQSGSSPTYNISAPRTVQVSFRTFF